jgi:hypothetical protein
LEGKKDEEYFWKETYALSTPAENAFYKAKDRITMRSVGSSAVKRDTIPAPERISYFSCQGSPIQLIARTDHAQLTEFVDG